MAPQSRAAAIAQIRALAQAGRLAMHRRAHERMELLDYDVTDVEDCLTGLSEDDCIGDGPPDHPTLAPKGWVYEFVIDYERDRLYVKVCLNPGNVYVISFKLDGSPA